MAIVEYLASPEKEIFIHIEWCHNFKPRQYNVKGF